MRNRPFHELSRPQRPSGPLIDTAPQLRLLVLFAAFTAPMLAIAARLYYVQVQIAERYITAWEQTQEFLESIPARDGRIVAADGRVLAYDQPRFDVAVHYRWLEEPPNPEWLDSQARLLLPKAERRVPSRLAEARGRVLAQREALFRALVETCGIADSQLTTARTKVQARVERIYASVLERRERDHQPARQPQPEALPLWKRGWRALVTELTTPPERPVLDPLVIQEQLAYHVLIEDVPLSAVAAIESAPSRFPGVETRQTSRRVYPAGPLASHIVGIRTPISGEELAERAARYPAGDPLGYESGDRVGRSGIEQAYNAVLRGRRGLKRIVKDRRGQVLRIEIVRPAAAGRDVVLSFDSRLQARAEALLDAAIQPRGGTEDEQSLEPLDAPPATAPPQGGCIVALDVRTGRILAAAAAPRFDPNLLINPDTESWERLLADPRQPLFPRATQMMVPPGSVFKILTAISVLESGLIDPDAPFYCQGYLDQPDRNRCLIYRHYGAGHGDVTLEDALCQSCNVYFFDAARRIGPRPIHDWAALFGIGTQTGVDVPGEKEGRLPSESDGEWYPGTTLQFAIGQASLLVTPLQVARMMAAVANDGYLVSPTFVQTGPGDASADERDILLAGFEDGNRTGPRRERIPGLSPGTLERIRAGLRLVVESPRGTGKRVRLEEVAIAGKTGTAEVGGGKPDHAWFAGYAPADDPRVAFVVVLEHGGSGGHVAGPVAREFVKSMLETGVLRAAPRPD